MKIFDYKFIKGDVTIQVTSDNTYHVKHPLAVEPIVTKCYPFEYYHLLERGEVCDIYLNLHRGCYAIFIVDVLQKSMIKTIGEARDFVRNYKPPTPLESLCTFSTFKRDAIIPGFTLTRLNAKHVVAKTINKVQTNAIVLNSPDSGASWLEFPPASLVEYNRNILRIYNAGYRLFNAKEKAALMEWESLRDIEAEERDAISDSNSQFYRQTQYWENKGMSYMYSTQKINGLRRELTENVVLDSRIKGELALEYNVYIPNNMD